MAETSQEHQADVGVGVESNQFAELLQKEFRPKSDAAKGAIENAVKTLSQQALAQASLISDDSLR